MSLSRALSYISDFLTCNCRKDDELKNNTNLIDNKWIRIPDDYQKRVYIYKTYQVKKLKRSDGVLYGLVSNSSFNKIQRINKIPIVIDDDNPTQLLIKNNKSNDPDKNQKYEFSSYLPSKIRLEPIIEETSISNNSANSIVGSRKYSISMPSGISSMDVGHDGTIENKEK